MTDNWRSYALADFVPYGAEVYRRLIERVGETYWPLQVLTLLLGVTFFFQQYAELNWAGPYLGGLFLAQAALLPGLWCLLSAAHLQVLGMPWWPALVVLAVMAAAGPLWQMLTRDDAGNCR